MTKRRKGNLLFSILLAFIPLILCAQVFAVEAGKLLKPIQKLKGFNNAVAISIIKDKRGYMWFTTNYGLVGYNGYDFKTYSYDPSDSTSIPNLLTPSTLIEGSDGRIWIGTWQNLFIAFDPATERFTSFKLDSLQDNLRNWISCIYEDKVGQIWLGLQYEGFVLFDPVDKSFRAFRQQTKEPIHNMDFVQAFHELDDVHMLFGTWEGLYVFNKANETIIPFTEYSRSPLPDGFEEAMFTTFYQDKNNTLWMGSDIGLFAYDQDKDSLMHYTHEPSNNLSLSGNFITDIFSNPLDGGKSLWVITSGLQVNKLNIHNGLVERYNIQEPKPTNVFGKLVDDVGRLWLASENQGIFFLDLNADPFRHFDVKTGEQGSEKYSGTAFRRDHRGEFWVGTGQGGLFRYNTSGQLVKRYVDLPGSLYSIPTLVYSIFEDSRRNLWISYWSDGLYRYEYPSGEFTRYDFYYPLADLPFTGSSEIIEDSFGRIWVGTTNGVYYCDPAKQDSLYFTWVDEPLLGDYLIRSLCEDQDSTIWFTTQHNGLFSLPQENRDSMDFIHYPHHPDKAGSISSNCVYSVYCSQKGELWAGTSNGLNRFDHENGTFEWFGIHNGFDAHFVFCVRTDKKGNIWAITDQGFARFNPDVEVGKKFKLYSEQDGLPFTDIYPYHFDMDRDGKIYVGGVRGFGMGYFSFHPDSLKDNTRIPPIAITGFKVRNEPFPLDSGISYKKNLSLHYDQNFLSFEFASLDYSDPGKNQYAYMMEGMDDDWIYSGNRRFANYTSLSPGNYNFRVKGSNNDGYWNETGTSIGITIAPPPWKTWWAYLGYLVVSVGIIILIIRFYLRRQQLLQELRIEQVEADKLKELDSMKSRFFANISHEFRTPLTLILGPVNKLLQKYQEGEDKKELSVARRNALRLQRMINQLLDLSKLEAGKMKLQCREMNLPEWIRQYIQSFESLARQKEITLEFRSSGQEIICFFDPEKMAQIMNNLLSNAFKFTDEGGQIWVKVYTIQSSQSNTHIENRSSLTAGSCSIVISDNGKGIPADKLPHIFDRFYQADDSIARRSEGTGIGLALVKELVELHHGTITAESEVGMGTTYTITFPLGAGHLKKDDLATSPEQEISPDTAAPEIQEVTANQSSALSGLPVMLIVEDNADMRDYIRGYFQQEYKLLEAINGRQGLQQALETIPDIIISDVMMPEMDGYEMCNALKADQRTNHIPVILLTARSSGADKIEGLETGADDFVIKPFDGKELQVRVRNLIEQRKLLRRHFHEEFNSVLPFNTSSYISTDKQFIDKALQTVLKELDNPEFSVEAFAAEMAMSRTQLHRKMNVIADMSTGDFIRMVRLKKAAEMLSANAGNVTEVAYAVGFNNPSWFSESFRKQFGIQPSEYRKNSSHTDKSKD